MRPLTQGSLWPVRRGPILSLGFFVFGLLLAYSVAGYIIANDLKSLAYIAIVCVGATFLGITLNNWRNGLYFFLAWLLFEDFARKFLGNNMAVYFAKDILVGIVYLSFFVAYRNKDKDLKTFRPPFLVALLLFVWFGVLQIFNPASTSIFYGLLGMKLYFYYMPLLMVGYALINSETELRRFFNINLGLMFVIAVLGVVQSVLGHTFLNPENPADDIRLLSQLYREAPISGVVVYRPTSVFVSAGRFGNMLMIAWLMVLGFTGYLLLRHRRGRIFAFIMLATTAGASVMSGARGVFMWTMGQREVLRVFRTLQRAGLGIALGLALLMFAFPQAFLDRLAVYAETLDPRSPASELVYRVRDYPLANFLLAFQTPRWPYGYGIGTVSLGGQYVTRILHVAPPTIGVESGFGSLIVEMGIGGLLLWFIMSGAVLISAWRVVRKLKGSPWFPLGFTIFWYAFLLLILFTFQGLQAYQDFVLNAYLWLLLGILFRLPTLALSSEFAFAAPASAPSRGWNR
jgi:hypothetical protein